MCKLKRLVAFSVLVALLVTALPVTFAEGARAVNPVLVHRPARSLHIMAIRTDGTTSPLPGSYTRPVGSLVMVTAYPKNGYEFLLWCVWENGNFKRQSLDNPYSFRIRSDTRIVSHFRRESQGYLYEVGAEVWYTFKHGSARGQGLVVILARRQREGSNEYLIDLPGSRKWVREDALSPVTPRTVSFRYDYTTT